MAGIFMTRPDADPIGTVVAARIRTIEIGSDRLYRADFLGRSWLAHYVADVDTMVTAYEVLRAECDRLRAVVEAARGVVNCMQPEEHVWTHINGGGCLGVLRDAVTALDAVGTSAGEAT